MASFRDLLKHAKAQVTEVDTGRGSELVHGGAVLLDVREPDEYSQGAVPASIHISRGLLESSIVTPIADKDTSLVVMFAGGVLSAFAA